MGRKIHYSARQRSGAAFKPRSHSIKAWARHIAKWGCAPVRIKNPDRYLNSHARFMVGLQRIIAARATPLTSAESAP